jgi:protein arginine kinase activator
MKCFLCEKKKFCPIHVTENNNGKWESFDLCPDCANQYFYEPPKQKKVVDLTDVETPEQLIDFISAHQVETKPPCPQCGTTLKGFDEKGRFGCVKCYDHFAERMEELVYPYHDGARKHEGKIPKSLLHNDKEKILKLRLAKAVEIENYEWAAEIKRELDDFNSSQQTP